MPRVTRAMLFGAAVSALFTACDARELVGPSGKGPRPSVSEPVQLATVTLTTPPTSSGADVSSLTNETITLLPESTWVVVHVNGVITTTNNPACANLAPMWGCPYGPIGVDFSAGYPWEGGPVSLHAWGGTWDVLPLRGTGGATGGSVGSAVGLRRQRAAGTLYGKLGISGSASYNPNGDPTDVASYLLSNGYEVSVKAIPSPMQITAASLGDSLGTVRYTVSTVEGLAFINPYSVGWWEPAGQMIWSFVVGDSVSDNPDSGGWTWSLDHCYGKTSCDWVPPRQGRMQVQAYVEAQTAKVRSGYVLPIPTCNGTLAAVSGARFDVSGSDCQAPQLPKLVLSCVPKDTVLRGSSLDCSATASPSGATVSEIAWSFADEAGHVIPGPTGTVLTWGGKMAMGGVMKVSGKVNGSPSSDSATITVRARDWAGRMPYPSALPVAEVDTAGAQGFPPVPVQLTPDGYDQWIPGALGFYAWGVTAGTFTPATGPNTGWYIRETPPRFVTPKVWLSTHLQPGDPFYEAQTGSAAQAGESPVPSGYTGYCTRSDMDVYLQTVKEHEGSERPSILVGPQDADTVTSHHQWNVDYFSQRDAAPGFERDVFYMAPGMPDDSLVANARRFREQYTNSVNAQNAAVTHAQANVYTLRCKVRYP